MRFLRAETGFRIYSRSRLARVKGLLAQNINFGKTHGALPAGQLHSDLDGEDLKLTENGIGGITGLYIGHLAAFLVGKQPVCEELEICAVSGYGCFRSNAVAGTMIFPGFGA